jgi:hypothetical protein
VLKGQNSPRRIPRDENGWRMGETENPVRQREREREREREPGGGGGDEKRLLKVFYKVLENILKNLVKGSLKNI